MKRSLLLTAAFLAATLTACKMHKFEHEPEMVAIPNSNYAMGKYEVTQGQWKAVMGNNPSSFKDCGDTCPVEQVSWEDTQIFIQKLNDKTGKIYRLPSESEWKAACFAGNQTVYCGGNDADAVAWYEGNSDGKTHSVGQKQPNAYGLYDMSGNVVEWMQDCYDNRCEHRAISGGAWGFFGTEFLRGAKHSGFVHSIRHNNIGFRLARTLP